MGTLDEGDDVRPLKSTTTASRGRTHRLNSCIYTASRRILPHLRGNNAYYTKTRKQSYRLIFVFTFFVIIASFPSLFFAKVVWQNKLIDEQTQMKVKLMDDLESRKLAKANRLKERAYRIVKEKIKAQSKKKADERKAASKKLEEPTTKEAVARSYGETLSLKSQLDSHLRPKRIATPISIVISHCDNSLDWVVTYLTGKDSRHLNIADIAIISKCGKPIEGIEGLRTVAAVDVIRLPNFGRCDHTYAYWIKEHIHEFNEKRDGDDVVIFIKDNDYLSQYYRSLHELFIITSEVGFGCMMKPIGVEIGPRHSPGDIRESVVLHNRAQVESFKIHGYARLARDQNNKFEGVSGNYTDVKGWIDAMGIHYPDTDLVPVCYKGCFATKKVQILKQPAQSWHRMEQSLSRGDNILEGHFAERTWAAALSDNSDGLLELASEVIAPYITWEDTYKISMYGHVFVGIDSKWANSYRGVRLGININSQSEDGDWDDDGDDD